MTVETSSLALGEEHRLRVFEIGVLTRIIGFMRKAVLRSRRRLRKVEVHRL
jgi:hypothetical protein